eukprot:gnl/Spiro4/18063_TR9649_c0_g1_i1.p1 gnl/Spiro4/18063_TR9649_c0_g1~~gnl/Spiro4/18063_TR9649_c0_g1_i1.p1  ORF type:complete len:342 (-),score=94.36 gnl/Spiro4/18063_TR9649_c0_g1_i1:146-1171(-)
MRTIIVLCFALLGLAAAQVLQPVPTAGPRVYSEQEVNFLWNGWKVQHSKTYRVDEEQQRRNIFHDNLKFVEAWNAQEGRHRVAMNHFGDLTKEEFKAMYNGLRLPAGHKFDFSLAAHVAVDASQPSSVDWRTKGYVTPVKDQGQCGSCYSFSSTGSMEGAVFKKTGKLTSISEQQLVDCSTVTGNAGCNGGLMTACFQYAIQVGGEETESAYPYQAVQGTCQFDQSKIASTISSFANVTAGSESDLTSKIATIGPISVAIDASHQSFQFYSSGVYNEPACSSEQLDHGVLAVGYGTDSVAGDYYIVKNSWGPNWGAQGYIEMSRNKNNQCGIASMASYPIA